MIWVCKLTATFYTVDIPNLFECQNNMGDVRCVLTLRLDPRASTVSALSTVSAASFQLCGDSSVPFSPKCTMVSLSSSLQL